jgi:dipeptidyl aminopeptidase/acylaminoacyl peptidase
MRIVFSILLAGLVTSASAQSPQKASEIPAATFAQLPIMQSAELSPDGTHLAYIRPLNGRGHLVIQDLAGGQPVVAPPAEDADFDWLTWASPDRLVFVISAMRKRGTVEVMETRLWAMDKDGSNRVHIVKPSRTQRTGSSLGRELAPPQLQHEVIHWLPGDPKHILVSVDGDHDAADEVRLVDIDDGDFNEVRRDTDGIQSWMADREGNIRLGWGYRNSQFKVLFRDATEPGWHSADKATWWESGYVPEGFTESPDIAYVIGENEQGFDDVRTMNLKTGGLLDVMFSVDGYDVDGTVDDPLTGFPVGVAYTDHQRKVHYFDEELAALQKAIDGALPHTVNRIESLTSDRRKVLIHSSSDIDAGTYSYLNRDTGNLSFVAEAMPGLPPELMSPVEPIEYVARDGLTIHGYLTVPRDSDPENLPVVVMPHGGPAARDSKEFWFLSQFLASRGYAIFQPNFRGSTGYGSKFQRAGRNEWGGKMQEDVTDGVHWLVEQGIADPEKLCIVGWSYGGYSAAMGAVQTPELYQCAASINGVLDLPRLISDDKRYIGGSAWTRHMGLEDENAKVVSPYHQAERITVPMLIVQAKDDARVHEDQGKRMARRLERLDKPVEYIEVEHGGHEMDNEPARLTILTALEAFLAENLGG